VPPALANLPPLRKFFILGVLPQMTLWIGFTAVVGSILGTVVTAIVRRKKQAAPAAV